MDNPHIRILDIGDGRSAADVGRAYVGPRVLSTQKDIFSKLRGFGNFENACPTFLVLKLKIANTSLTSIDTPTLL